MDEVVHVKLKGRKKFIKNIDEVTKHVSLLNKELKNQPSIK